MEYFFIYLAASMMAIVLVYTAMRAIDYAFSKREDDRHYGYDLGKINYARHQLGKLSRDVSKTINDGLMDAFRNMGDGV